MCGLLTKSCHTYVINILSPDLSVLQIFHCQNFIREISSITNSNSCIVRYHAHAVYMAMVVLYQWHLEYQGRDLKRRNIVAIATYIKAHASQNLNYPNM